MTVHEFFEDVLTRCEAGEPVIVPDEIERLIASCDPDQLGAYCANRQAQWLGADLQQALASSRSRLRARRSASVFAAWEEGGMLAGSSLLGKLFYTGSGGWKPLREMTRPEVMYAIEDREARARAMNADVMLLRACLEHLSDDTTTVAAALGDDGEAEATAA